MTIDNKKPTFASIEIDLNSSEPYVAKSQLDVEWALEKIATTGWHPVTETLLAAEVLRLRAKLRRVEALLLRDNLYTFTGGDGREYQCIWPEELEAALRGVE